jgi:hypothetical protein
MSSESFKDAEIEFLEEQNRKALASLRHLEIQSAALNQQISEETARVEQVTCFRLETDLFLLDEERNISSRKESLNTRRIQCENDDESQ